MKKCTKCEQQKLLADFSKDGQKSDGLSSHCRTCRKEAAAKKYLANKDKILARNAAWARANQEKVASTKKKYRQENSERISLGIARWRLNNSEKAAFYVRKWREKVGKERVLADAKRRREANPESGRLAALAWQKRNRAKATANQVARHAAKLKAIPGWADLEKVKLMYEAARDLYKKNGVSYHVDHVVPLVSDLVCGLHWEGNLQIITASENRSKGNRHWPDMP
jgi:hypothetical protein